MQVSRSGHGLFRAFSTGARRVTFADSPGPVDGTGARAYAADSPGRMAAQKRAELGDVLMANEEVRRMKRRLGIAEEALRIKKERLEDAVQEYDEEHKTFTIFSKRLEEKWEQRFDAVSALARASGFWREI